MGAMEVAKVAAKAAAGGVARGMAEAEALGASLVAVQQEAATPMSKTG